MRIQRGMLWIFVSVIVAACGTTATLPESAGMGPDPKLPEPQKEIIPTIQIAPAKGWASGGKPVSAQGTSVAAFADGLDHPRWLYVLPIGDVLVAETAAPERPEDGKGIKGWFMKKAMTTAGSAVPTRTVPNLRETSSTR